MILSYIPMISKKEPCDVLVEELHSVFYHSFPPYIENGKLTKLGLFLAVGLAVGCASRIIRCFFRHD